jgi:hypothetical protein
MPRYFFDVWEDEALPEDREGVEFPASRPQKPKPLSLCLPSPRATVKRGPQVP